MDNKSGRRLLGSLKGRLALVAIIVVTTYLVGVLWNTFSHTAPIILSSGPIAVMLHVLLGLAVLLEIGFLTVVAVLVIWFVSGLALEVVSWIRTGHSSHSFDTDYALRNRRRDNG